MPPGLTHPLPGFIEHNSKSLNGPIYHIPFPLEIVDTLQSLCIKTKRKQAVVLCAGVVIVTDELFSFFFFFV